jgi:hypothetical protein
MPGCELLGLAARGLEEGFGSRDLLSSTATCSTISLPFLVMTAITRIIANSLSPAQLLSGLERQYLGIILHLRYCLRDKPSAQCSPRRSMEDRH